MKNHLDLKLVAIINSIKMILYDAQGLKIISKPQELALTEEKHRHHVQGKNQNLYQNKSNPASLFEPHTSPKDIEHLEAARAASKLLQKVVNQREHKYKELIIAAEPQMLGVIRQSLSANIKKMISKELSKDLIHHDTKSIEEIIFS